MHSKPLLILAFAGLSLIAGCAGGDASPPDPPATEEVKAGAPAYFADIKKELAKDVEASGEEAEFKTLKPFTAPTHERDIKKAVREEVADLLSATELRTADKFGRLLDETLTNGKAHAAAIFSIAQSKGATIFWFESFGEDGIFIVRGFVVADPTTKTALMLHMETQA